MERSLELELLETEALAWDAVQLSYREMASIHHWLGNTASIVRLLRKHPARRVLDIGCGQGALLATLKQKLGVEGVGVDLRPGPSSVEMPIVQANAVTDALPAADVALCVATAHHMSEEELSGMIANVARSTSRFILLDLVRHPLPLLLFQCFVAPLLSSVSARDGITSIRRSYTAHEMDAIVAEGLRRAGREVKSLRHTVGPLWIRQVVAIDWR